MLVRALLSAKLTKSLSEEDQMRLALEQSMQDSVVEGAGAEDMSQEQIKLAMEQSLQESRLGEGRSGGVTFLLTHEGLQLAWSHLLLGISLGQIHKATYLLLP